MQKGALRAVIARFAHRNSGLSESDRQMIESAFWAGVEVMADVSQCELSRVSHDLIDCYTSIKVLREQLRKSRRTMMEELEEADL